MNLNNHLSRLILITEDLLVKEEVDSCIAICEEIEIVLREELAENKSHVNNKQQFEKLKSIKVKLNNIMANKVRQNVQ
jgi:hypothetical protein